MPLSENVSENGVVALLGDGLASPSPRLARAVSLGIVALAVIAMAWAILAETEVVVSAQGRIVPSGRVKVMQAMEPGTVQGINVHDGQRVSRGELLLELDDTPLRADLQRLERRRQELELSALRLRAQVAGDPALFRGSAALDASLAEIQFSLLANQLEHQQAREQVLAQQVDERHAAIDALASTIANLEERLPLQRHKLGQYRRLEGEGGASQMEVVAARLDLLETEQELESGRHRLRELTAKHAAAIRERDEAVSGFQAETLAELLDVELELHATRQELVKTERRISMMRITAPVDGTVQQLAIHTIGAVVVASQPLMTIVPERSGLEVEAMVNNRDIGALTAGHPVDIKVDAFDFTRHGSLPGRLQWVGTDSIEDERRGSVYPVRIELDGTRLPHRVDGRISEVGIGMNVTADIVIGRRRVIDYFLGPILRYRDESLREY